MGIAFELKVPFVFSSISKKEGGKLTQQQDTECEA
jgi:hypothetical protein